MQQLESAQEKPVVGLIPKAQKPIKMDGKLDDWDGAFVTPVHVGHPDFANRGGQFLYLWDEKNLYIGLRCLDQKPAHVGTDNQIWNGDAVEFYLDTRRGDKLGAAAFGPGTLHMFYTPFTKTDVKPRLQVRDLPAFKDFKLQGAEVAAEKTPWGWTAEFKLPWVISCSLTPISSISPERGGDHRHRLRTLQQRRRATSGSHLRLLRSRRRWFPVCFRTSEAGGQDRAESLKPLGRALLPLSLTRSTNYAWLYGTVCVSPTID